MAVNKINSRSPYFIVAAGSETVTTSDTDTYRLKIVQVVSGSEISSPGQGTSNTNITLKAIPVNFTSKCFKIFVTVIENPHCGESGVPFINKQTLFSLIRSFIFFFISITYPQSLKIMHVIHYPFYLLETYKQVYVVQFYSNY